MSIRFILPLAFLLVACSPAASEPVNDPYSFMCVVEEVVFSNPGLGGMETTTNYRDAYFVNFNTCQGLSEQDLISCQQLQSMYADLQLPFGFIAPQSGSLLESQGGDAEMLMGNLVSSTSTGLVFGIISKPQTQSLTLAGELSALKKDAVIEFSRFAGFSAGGRCEVNLVGS